MRKSIILYAAMMLIALMACKNNAKEKAEIIDLPRAETPDSVAQAMDTFFQEAAKDSMDVHSVMIVKDGNVIFSRWQSEGVDSVPHMLHSVSKTFTATAVGLAIHDGKMKLTDKIVDFFPDKLPANPSENLKAMTVRDLLTMSCGHDDDPTGTIRNAGDDWVKAFLAYPVKHQPGTFYCYNSLGTYVLSAIVQKVTGEKVVDYLNTRLFEPLHIDKPKWEESPQGINTERQTAYPRRLGERDVEKTGRQCQPRHPSGASGRTRHDCRDQRLDARLRLSDVAVPSWLFPCRWCQRPIYHRRSRETGGHCHHLECAKPSGRTQPRLEPHPPGVVEASSIVITLGLYRKFITSSSTEPLEKMMPSSSMMPLPSWAWPKRW